MRLINRNFYRKFRVILVFCAFLVPFILLIHIQKGDNKDITTQSTTAKSDKNWEWSQEKLKDFMHLLNKHKQPIDNNVLHFIHPTNISTVDNRIQFPLLNKYLPFISDEESALMPSYVLSKRPINKRASIVFGVPHIKRSKESYLQLTLYFLIKNLKPQHFEDTLIIVFIAETDLNYVTNTTRMIAHHFKEYIDSGILSVISPAKSFYPDFDKLYKKQTLGDPLKRVHWRTKQNLDFAYLMMYSYSRGDYYVQLEDDVISSPDYVGKIKQCIIDLKNNNTDWFTIRFCRLGFIGQMLKSSDLPQLISFLLIFHEDQPSDWLLDDLIQTKTCRKDKDMKHCRKQKDLLWRTFPTSLFQHIGYHSSLEGKVQKLKDKFFKTKEYSYFAHKENPEANAMTSLSVYQSHTISKAYNGEDFFWAMDPKADDNITFTFTKQVLLDEVMFQSGNFDHPQDRIADKTTIELLPLKDSKISNFTQTSDGYYIIGSFEDGFAKIDNLRIFDLVKELRISFHNSSKYWLILSEIQVKAAK